MDLTSFTWQLRPSQGIITLFLPKDSSKWANVTFFIGRRMGSWWASRPCLCSTFTSMNHSKGTFDLDLLSPDFISWIPGVIWGFSIFHHVNCRNLEIDLDVKHRPIWLTTVLSLLRKKMLNRGSTTCWAWTPNPATGMGCMNNEQNGTGPPALRGHAPPHQEKSLSIRVFLYSHSSPPSPACWTKWTLHTLSLEIAKSVLSNSDLHLELGLNSEIWKDHVYHLFVSTFDSKLSCTSMLTQIWQAFRAIAQFSGQALQAYQVWEAGNLVDFSSTSLFGVVHCPIQTTKYNYFQYFSSHSSCYDAKIQNLIGTAYASYSTKKLFTPLRGFAKWLPKSTNRSTQNAGGWTACFIPQMGLWCWQPFSPDNFSCILEVPTQ